MVKEIWDKPAIQRAIVRITYEIIERYKGVDELAGFSWNQNSWGLFST